jgi:hypothetical protein
VIVVKPNGTRLFVASLAAILLSPRAAPAGSNWKEEKPYKELLAQEDRVLRPLLKSAVKEEYRRQAWYLADRLAAANPKDAESRGVLEKWRDHELQLGMVPKKGWTDKLERSLEEVGNSYAKFAEVLSNSTQIPAEEFYPVNIRALLYGATYAPSFDALKGEGFEWGATLGEVKKEDMEKTLGPIRSQVSFPKEFDDEFLKVKLRWPEAKTVAIGPWRLVSDRPAPEMLRIVRVLAGADAWFQKKFGSTAKGADVPTSIVLFPDAKTYDKIGLMMIEEAERKDFAGTSGWARPWHHMLLALWRHRTNAWIGEDAALLGHFAPLLARRHLGAGTVNRMNGRGSWILDGLGGVLEGLTPKGDVYDVDPSKCWRIATAKALQAESALLPWETLVEMDQAKMDAEPKKTVKVTFENAPQEAKDVDVPRVQAAAFVLAMLQLDGGKGAPRLGLLLADYLKRDSLPDLDKAMGLKKGGAFAAARKMVGDEG